MATSRVVTRRLLSSSFHIGKTPSILARTTNNNSTCFQTALCFSLTRPNSVAKVTPRSSSCIGDWTPTYRVSCIFNEKRNVIRKSRAHYQGDERHWLIFLGLCGLDFDSEEALFRWYIKFLAEAVGSEEEAKRRIYLVSCGWGYGFGAELDENERVVLPGLGGFLSMYEDSNYHGRNKDHNVQTAARFSPMNFNRRLDNIYSYYHLSEQNSNWNSDHWLINMKKPAGGQRQILDYCIKMLAEFVGSEEAAEEKIYIIWFKFPFGFGAEIDEEISHKLKGLPNVLKVLPDYAFDIKDKRQGVLSILPPFHGLRFSHYCPTEDHSRDWIFDMEEYYNDSGESIYSPVKFIHDLCDFFWVKGGSHCKDWFITIERPGAIFDSTNMKIDCCFRTLADIVGSEEEAEKKIYRVKCGRDFIGFGAKIDEETSNKLKGLPGITAVLDDYSYNTRDIDSEARSVPQFAPVNRNGWLRDIFSYHHLSGCNSKWQCDHWLIHVNLPNVKRLTEKEIVDYFVCMLAEILGSEEDAKRKIYIVWCEPHFGFAAEIDKETAYKLKGRPVVLTVLPDYAFHVKKRISGVLAISPAYFFKSSRRNIFYRYNPTDADDDFEEYDEYEDSGGPKEQCSAESDNFEDNVNS